MAPPLKPPKKHLVERPIIRDNGIHVNSIPKYGVLEYWNDEVSDG
jgi:hypothetical protein